MYLNVSDYWVHPTMICTDNPEIWVGLFLKSIYTVNVEMKMSVSGFCGEGEELLRDIEKMVVVRWEGDVGKTMMIVDFGNELPSENGTGTTGGRNGRAGLRCMAAGSFWI